MKATSRARVYVPLSLFLFIVMAVTFASASTANAGAVRQARLRGRSARAHALLRAPVRQRAAVRLDALGLRPGRPAIAYNLPSTTAGAGQTVAIVDAFDDPNAETDLATYRSTYGLPPCTTANGCFQKVNQTGGTTATRARRRLGAARSRSTSTWSAPSARTARSSSSRRPRTSTRTSAPPWTRPRGSARTRSRNSYGGGESSTETADDVALQPPGHRHHGELGRRRLRRRVPGGVALRHRRRRHVARRAAAAPAAGPRAPGAAPAAAAAPTRPSRPGRRTPAAPGARSPTSPRSPTRTPASPSTTPTPGSAAGTVFGGTSASAPIIAGVYALAGNAASVDYGSYPYSHTARSSTSPPAATAPAARPTCAPAAPATTAPPASARRTASQASSVKQAAGHAEAVDPVADRATGLLEYALVAEQLESRVRRLCERVQLERDLPCLEPRIELACFLGLLDRVLEVRHPAAEHLLDPVAHRSRAGC